MLTREAIVFYAVVGGALASCLLVLAGMGVKKLMEVSGKWTARSCSKTTNAR